MFAGPIFTREALTAPRRLRHYLMRSGYVGILLVLMYTVRQATVGFQDTRFSGDTAAFSSLVFGLFSLLQLTLGMFFATLFTAANIAQEKDRRTLILLLMTDIRSRELTYGKLLSSLLVVGVLIAASIPVFCALRLLGGVTWQQVLWVEALIVSSVLLSGAWGCLVAYWREKTFQTLAISVLGVVVFVALTEGLAVVLTGTTAGKVIGWAAPYRALFSVLDPLSGVTNGIASVSAFESVLVLLSLAAALSVFTVLRLRIWNPSQALRQSVLEEDQESEATERKSHRAVWDNPVTWKEMATSGYGRKVVVIKSVYILLVALIGYFILSSAPAEGALVMGMVSPASAAFLAIGVISLLLINAQSVTSISTERDSNTLDILLATDISAKEFMTGKISGAVWNAREMFLGPVILIIWMMANGNASELTVENLVYVIVTYVVLGLFSVMLGLHSGLTYENSRSAIGNSLGTMFFLFVGMFVFMLLLVEARSTFMVQLQSFIVFIGMGGIGLFVSLTHKNPSPALSITAVSLPFLSFYAITEFLLGGSLGVCLAICTAYGFGVVAMLVPSITNFDVALGKTTNDIDT